METDLDLKTIKKYFKGFATPSSINLIAEEAKVGKHALTELVNLSTKFPNIKKFTQKFIAKEFNGNHLPAIKRVTNILHYQFLKESEQDACVTEVINLATFNNELAKEIVYLKAIKNNWDQEVIDFVFNVLMTDLNKVISICNADFMKHLNKEQINQLHHILNALAVETRLPIQWSPFPPSDLQKDEGLDEDNMH